MKRFDDDDVTCDDVKTANHSHSQDCVHAT